MPKEPVSKDAKWSDVRSQPDGPGSRKMTGNVNETAAESHQILWRFSFWGGVDSHHLWFHFAAVSVTFPANGRPSDPAVPDFLTFSATHVCGFATH